MFSSRVPRILLRLIRFDSILRLEQRLIRTGRRAGIPALAGFLTMAATAVAQTIIPVDPKFPPPDRFSFQGSWSCGEASSAGMLRVGKATNRSGRRLRSLTSAWTEVREAEQDLAGNYFVAYDRDRQRFIMIDADDPAYAAYSTDGWHGLELTLTSEETLMPRHRLVFKIDNRRRFTLTYAVWDSAAWVASSSFTCRKISER